MSNTEQWRWEGRISYMIIYIVYDYFPYVITNLTVALTGDYIHFIILFIFIISIILTFDILITETSRLDERTLNIWVTA